MPSRRKTTPSYLFHKQSGRARAVWTDSLGIRQQKLLPGLFDSEVSRTAHARLALELAAMPTIAVKSATLTVQEVLLAYHEHATTYYGDGKELDAISRCIRAVRLIYGDTLAAEFGPAKLKVVRQSIVDAGLCRKQVNKRVDRIRRAFRWAVGEELVPTSVYEGLRALAPLMPGKGIPTVSRRGGLR